jgi:phosphate transport system permease protein
MGSKRSIGWMGLKRGHRARPLEWLAEKTIFVVSLIAILMVFLIFVFIGKEALPVLFGRMNTALDQKLIPVDQMDSLTPDALRNYLGLSKQQLASMDHDTLKTLMELKLEARGEQSQNPDASVNSTRWRYLLGSYQWSGYSKPEFIWHSVPRFTCHNWPGQRSVSGSSP